MKKLLLMAMLFSAPVFACDCDQSAKIEQISKKHAKKAEKARMKAHQEARKEKKKKLDEGYKQWRKSEKKKHKKAVASTVYWSPNTAFGHDIRVKRDSSGNRVDTSFNI